MQASGLTEFIPFICTLAIWGQILFCFIFYFSHLLCHPTPPPALWQSPWGWWHAGSQALCSLSKALIHFWKLEITVAVTPLFIDMAGDIPFHMGEDLELGICGQFRMVLSSVDVSSEWGWTFKRASLVAQMVKNLPAMRETRVRSLGWEGPQEKGMEIHSNILVWEVPRADEPGRLQSMGLVRLLRRQSCTQRL